MIPLSTPVTMFLGTEQTSSGSASAKYATSFMNNLGVNPDMPQPSYQQSRRSLEIENHVQKNLPFLVPAAFSPT